MLNFVGILLGTAVPKTIGTGLVAAGVMSTVAVMGALLGAAVSTTHTVTGAILGVGASRRLSAVRWGLGIKIASAWLLTLPCCFGLGVGARHLLDGVHGAP